MESKDNIFNNNFKENKKFVNNDSSNQSFVSRKKKS